jgi:cell division protein FtsB
MAMGRQFANLRSTCAIGLMLTIAAVMAHAQNTPGVAPDVTAEVVRDLRSQVSELQAAIKELREEARQYRAETQELRTELRAAVAQARPATAVADTAQAPLPDSQSILAGTQSTREHDHLARLEEQYDLLSGKIDDQYQTKVESASKYRVRLSGIVLFNMFNNRGAVDNLDFPAVALSTIGRSEGSFGGTLRQSQIGLEVFGPTVAGARVRGNLQLDLSGGFPDTENGVTMGLMRLRTAVVRMDWPRTSLIAGQDAPFFSPLSPTSLASLALPALSYSGNLWTWVPQLRVEHRIVAGENSRFTIQAGILDPLTGERPGLQFERLPQAGEASRQPGYATRVAWSSGSEDRPAALGVGGYYSRQNWSLGRTVDGWAATADWSIPLGRLLSVTGEFYRGRAIGGFGGALGGTVLYTGAIGDAATRVAGLDAVGGWAQIKLRTSPKLEFNLAGGQDNPFSSEIRSAIIRGSVFDYDAVRNRSILTNVIYRPRSDVLLSAEYRRIRSFDLTPTSRSADHINLMMGVLF